MSRLRRLVHRDDGNAIIEFLGLALLLFLPLVYLVVAVFEVQRNVFAVKQAAREAGRAMATADSLSGGEERARFAAALALRDQSIDGAVSLRYVPADVGCDAAVGGAASLRPGADFAVCATRAVAMPGVPGFAQGRGIQVTGRYVVRIDCFRPVVAGQPQEAGRRCP